MKIVIAPNSFKNSLDAFEVARAIQRGFDQSQLNASCKLYPIADGGDYTLEVFHAWRGGQIERSTVTDPLGNRVEATWLYLPQTRTAVIEMAKASGIHLIKKKALNPWKASSYGTGELICQAVKKGATNLLIGIGGSATVDGGLGMMQALGAELKDAVGQPISTDHNALMDLKDIFTQNIQEDIRRLKITVLCDVENLLLGPKGAVNVFGPQKGASPEDVNKLEMYMRKFGELTKKCTGQDFSNMPGSGAAGGMGFALMAFLGARMVNGVAYLIEKMELESQIKTADLLITAEGRADKQTLGGKGPMGVARLAKKYDVPCVMLAGQVEDFEMLNHGFDAIFSITNGAGSLEQAMQNTAQHLTDTCCQLGNLFATTARR